MLFPGLSSWKVPESLAENPQRDNRSWIDFELLEGLDQQLPKPLSVNGILHKDTRIWGERIA